jgi:hypothetical protein
MKVRKDELRAIEASSVVTIDHLGQYPWIDISLFYPNFLALHIHTVPSFPPFTKTYFDNTYGVCRLKQHVHLRALRRVYTGIFHSRHINQ